MMRWLRFTLRGFPPRIVRMLHARYTCSYRVLRRITYISQTLDIPWDPGIIPVFIEDDLPLSHACAFLHVSSTMANSSQRPVSSPPLWFRLDARMPIPQPPLWPIEMLRARGLFSSIRICLMFVIATFTIDECFQAEENNEDIVILVVFILV